jgi:hypothetical protein
MLSQAFPGLRVHPSYRAQVCHLQDGGMLLIDRPFLRNALDTAALAHVLRANVFELVLWPDLNSPALVAQHTAMPSICQWSERRKGSDF